VLILPFRICDEDAHLLRAFEVSKFKILSIKTPETTGDFLPRNLIQDTQLSETLRSKHEGTFKGSVTGLRKLFSESANNRGRSHNEEEFASFPNTALYSPIPYIPQVISIWIADLFHFSGLQLLYLGRFINLLFFILIFNSVLVLLEFSTRLKLAFFWLASLPCALSQFASMSADNFTQSISFLTAALGFSLYHRFTNKRFYLFLLTTILLSLCKLVYFAIPLFLLPKLFIEFKRTKKTFIYCSAVILAAGIPNAIWSYYSHLSYSPARSDVNPALQLTFFFSNPIHCLNVFALSLYRQRSVIVSMFIGGLGWWDAYIGDPYTSFGIAGLAILPFFALEKDNFSLPRGARIVSTLILLGTVFVLSLTMYLSWTPVGSPSVEGLIGRYFIPCFPLVFGLYGVPYLISRRSKAVYLTVLSAVWAALHVEGARVLILRFWAT
jgi:uncharacterized membrane protein